MEPGSFPFGDTKDTCLGLINCMGMALHSDAYLRTFLREIGL